jgi:hypothetical protein
MMSIVPTPSVAGAPGGRRHGARSLVRCLPLAAIAAASLGCANDDQDVAPRPSTAPAVEQDFPDVLDATVTADGDRFAVSATISSPYDSEERYADAFRVLAPGGQELGVRELTHPHTDEQPFTRRLDDVAIPADLASVTIEGRDLVNGWGGATVTVPVPGR